MSVLENPLKLALHSGRRQIGLWCSLGSPTVTEVLAGSGFDWLLIDTEHSPNDLLSVLHHAQAAAAYATELVVRIPNHDVSLLKRYLDLGIRSFLVPNVETVEQASHLASALRYPPNGTRGFSMSQRANRFGRVKNYHGQASENVFLAIQIESRAATRMAQELSRVPGVDALFVGPGDLSAEMGHIGNPSNPDVQAAIKATLALGVTDPRVVTGTLTSNESDARRYLEWGATFLALGSDLNLLTTAADGLAARFTQSPRDVKS